LYRFISLETCTVVFVHIVFWYVTPCSHVGGYRLAEERAASVFRMESTGSYEMSVFIYKTTWRYNPKYTCIYFSLLPIVCHFVFHSLITLRSRWVDSGLIRGRGKKYFSSPVSRPAPGPTQSPIQLLPGVKRPGREADHSLASPAEVMLWCLIS
jgi:hypothetical protein